MSMSFQFDLGNLREAMRAFPPLYVIYRKPKDFPKDEYILRVWFGTVPYAAFGFQRIENARNTANRMGACFCLLPNTGDDPCIVESWI